MYIVPGHNFRRQIGHRLIFTNQNFNKIIKDRKSYNLYKKLLKDEKGFKLQRFGKEPNWWTMAVVLDPKFYGKRDIIKVT